MYETQADYKRAITSDVQQIVPFITIGVGIDTTAMDDVSAWAYNGLPMSNTKQVNDASYFLSEGLAVYEADGIPTASSYGMVAPSLHPEEPPPEVGIWSDVISDAAGNVDWSIKVNLNKPHRSAFTVYTGGVVNILSATFVYRKNGAVVRNVTIAGTEDHVQDKEVTEYDEVTVTVTKVSKAYSHVRVSEIEFGASKTVSNAKLTDTVVSIFECDPLDLSIPLYELDFNLININGDFDVDNPSHAIDEFKIGTPVNYSLTVYTETGQVTVPMGKFYIVSRNADEDRLSITAQDIRSILQNTVRPISLKTSLSLGLTLQTMFEQNDIPFVIEQELYSVYPDADYTFADDLDILKQLLYVQQYFDVFTLPERDGFIHAFKGIPSAQGRPITADILTKYPKPTLARGYNFISINYKGGHYDIDLRGTPDAALLPLNIDNPLVQTEAKAREIADRIRGRFFTQEYRVESFGDPSTDVWDMAPISGRWTQNNPETYRLISVEFEYDGALIMRARGVK